MGRDRQREGKGEETEVETVGAYRICLQSYRWALMLSLALPSQDPDVSSNCSTICPFPPPCLVTAPLFSAQEKSAHAHSFTSLHVQESALFLKVRPTSIHCKSVSPLYTLRSVLGPSQSNKATTGSGLVQANINNPPHSSEGRLKQGLRNGLLGY